MALKVSDKSPGFRNALSALPDAGLDRIAWFLFGNGFFKLIRTGDRALRAKLLRTSSLTVLWESANFCDWSACHSFIASFPNLRELVLRTESLRHYVKAPLDVEMLPSSLVKLHLCFRGVFRLMAVPMVGTEPKEPFKRFKSLETLYLEQAMNDDGIYTGQVSLRSLPDSLAHLHVRCAGAGAYFYLYEDLEYLPRALQTFDVDISMECHSNPAGGLQLGGAMRAFFGAAGGGLVVFPNASYPQPSSLSFLRMTMSTYSVCIDVSQVASSLTYLCVNRGGITFNNKLLFLSQTTQSGESPFHPASIISQGASCPYSYYDEHEHVSIRKMLPNLRSLSVELRHWVDWSIFETLPLSLTRLSASFSYTNIKSIQDMCEDLNTRYLSSSSEDRPGAPAMLIAFHLPTHLGYEIASILQYFPSLLSLDLTKTRRDSPPLPSLKTCLPPRLRHLSFWRLSDEQDDLSVLPRTLESLRVVQLSLKRMESMMGVPRSLDSESCFPRLASLSVETTAASHTLISILPNSLESLSLVVDDASVLEALTLRANVENLLPQLNFLKILVPYAAPTELKEPIVISLRTIPASIATLKIYGSYQFPLSLEAPSRSLNAPLSSYYDDIVDPTSLRFHTKMQDWSSSTPQRTEILLPQLPRTLRILSFDLASSLDFNRLDVVEALQDIPPLLWELNIVSSERVPLMVPLDGWNIESKLRLVDGNPSLPKSTFGRNEVKLPISLRKAALLCEDFLFRCLPRSLRSVRLDVPQSYKHSRWHSNVFLLIAEARLYEPWHYVKRFIISRLPLIGFLLRPTNSPRMLRDTGEKRFTVAPPRISLWTSIFDSSPILIHPDKLLKAPSRPLHEDLSVDREKSEYRILFHIFNIALWSFLGRYFPMDRQTHPFVWALYWNNILGSVLNLPVLVYRRHSALALPPSRNSFSSMAVQFVMVVLIPWTMLSTTTGASWLIAGGVTSSRWSTLSRVSALVVGTIGEALIQFMTHTLW